ncbi:cell adhesion molecule [Mactra antiquata]
MSGFFNLIFGVCVFTHLFYTTECAVTVTMESGDFLCGHSTKLKCVISSYGGGMTWKLDGTIIAQCAFGSCNPLGALPSGDNFTHDESTGTFFLDIGITHADNGTMYQCDDGSNQDQTTVNIKVPPHTGSSITVSGTTLSVAAGCFYPAANGKIAIYCVTGGTETLLDTVTMARTTIGCTGDCAGPGIFMATGSATIDNSTGSSAYRVKVYLDGYGSNALTLTDTSAIYDCDNSRTTTSTTTTTTNTPTTTSTTSTTSTTTTSPTATSTTSTTTTTSPTTLSTLSTTSTTAATTHIPTTSTTPVSDKPELPTEFRHREDLTTATSIGLTWKPGFNGGLSQTFHIKYKESTTSTWKYVNVKDTDVDIIQYTLTDLTQNTQYDIIIYASNRKGKSEESSILVAFTKEGTDNTTSVIWYAVGATSGCLILVLLSVYLVWRFRKKRADDNNQDVTSRNDRAISEDPVVETGDNKSVSVSNYEALKMENRDASNYSVLVDSPSADDNNQDVTSRNDRAISEDPVVETGDNKSVSVSNYEALKMENRDASNYSVLVDSTSDRLKNKDEYENMKLQ